MSVLSWFEHFLGFSPTKPAAANWSTVADNVGRAVDVATAGIGLAVAAGTIDAPTKAKIDEIMPDVSKAVATLKASALPSDVNTLFSDLHLVAAMLPPKQQAEVNVAIAVANVALAAFQHS